MIDLSDSVIIDLSHPLRHGDPKDPVPTRIRRIGYRKGAIQLGLLYLLEAARPWQLISRAAAYLLGKARVTSRHFPGGQGLVWEELRLSTHAGTHLDAPAHYGPTSNGSAARSIDQVPLEWCIGDGLLLDFSWQPAGAEISLQDVQATVARIGAEIKPGTIVLLRTRAGLCADQKAYRQLHCGLSIEALAWLIDQGVRIVGTDAWSLDRPSEHMLREYLQTRDSNKLWPAHLFGRRREYCHIEQLANLDELPAVTGFKVICLPIKIEAASAGWYRVVALVNKRPHN